MPAFTEDNRPALPGRKEAADRRAEMIRVDHAGEHGAVRIYEGQLAVLGRRPSTRASAATIKKMADQEQHHLDTFNRLVAEHKVRPTALQPLWDVAGFALGAATALMGEKAAMACTAAVEDVIDEHYAAQERELKDETSEFKEVVSKFRQEEIEHKETALAEGAEQAPGYEVLSATIKAGCRLAIKLSEKI